MNTKCMTFIVSTLLSALVPTWVSAQNYESVGTMDLTLQKAIEIALAENPTIKIADKDVQLKEIADKEAWQSLLPTVDGTVSASYSIMVAKMKMGGQTFKMGQDGTTTGTASVSVAVPIFAPTVYQNMKLTKDDIALAQEKARASKLDLINQVTKAYYSALLSKDSYDVMKRSYETSKENFDVVDKKYGVGAVSEYDKISAEVQMRSMNSSMVSAKTGLTLALLQLKVLMGVTSNVDININDSLKAYESKLTLGNTTFGEGEVANNSSMKQIDLNAKMLDRTYKLLQTNFMPTVSMQLSGQYQSISNENLKVWSWDWSPSATLLFTVSVPIYHASNYTKLKTNRLQQLELGDTRVNTARQLSMAAQSYQKNMETTLNKLESDREAVKQADKAVNISAKRYEVGRGTILELNQSETALVQAELTYRQSIYDYLSNKADLDYTLGRE